MRRRTLLLFVPFVVSCKTSAPPPAPDAAASASATPAISAAPRRWTALAPKRALADAPQTSHLAFVGDALLAWGKRTARVYAKDASTPSAKLDLPDGELIDESAATLLLGSTGGKVTAWDARSLDKKWTLDAATIRHAARVGDLLVAVVAGATEEIVGVDPASGTVKWRTNAAPTSRVFADGEMLVTGSDGRVARLDPHTGKEVWTKEIMGSRPVAADAKHTVTAWQKTHVWDTAKGDDLGEVTPILRQYFAATIDGNAFFGLAAGMAQTRLFAVDLATKKEVWFSSSQHAPKGEARAPGEPPPPDYREDLAVDDDVIFFAASDGIVFGIDRATGQQRWRYPVYGGGGLAVQHAPKTTLYVTGPESVLVFEEGTPQSEKATIKGTVTLDGKPAAGLVVAQEAQRAKTDAKGAFTLEAESVGAIRLHVDGPSPKKGCTVSSEKIVELSGKGTYEVTIPASSLCPTK